MMLPIQNHGVAAFKIDAAIHRIRGTCNRAPIRVEVGAQTTLAGFYLGGKAEPLVAAEVGSQYFSANTVIEGAQTGFKGLAD